MRHTPIILLTLLLLTAPGLLPPTHAQDPWWNQAWSYRQDLTLPLSLSTPGAPGQPIDLRLTPQHPCWTHDETHTSIRVIHTHNGDPTELESEISNLTYTAPDQLASCRLVFLLPTDLSKDDTLAVYYDDHPTPLTTYPDHITITTSTYYLEPIPGYAIHSSYYLITDDTRPTYAISYAGQFLYTTTAQYITKLRPNATTVLPTTTDMLADFEFKYYYNEANDQFATTADHATTHTILHDGTLSATIQITSASHDQNLHTTATYTYYHTTTTQTRIRAHVDHTAQKDCAVCPGASTDGTYAQLQCGGIHCTTLPELTIDRLYPYTHLHTATGREEYRLDPTPDYAGDTITRLFSPTDNIDLDAPAWASFDDGPNGTAHALLFATTHVLQHGDNEHDGIQTNLYESTSPNLPGFHNTIAVLQCNRNSADAPGIQDLQIPADFHASYDAEFFTSQTSGYPAIETEAACYPLLASILPTAGGGPTTPEKPEPLYTLKVLVSHAPSMPFGEALSILRGKNHSYITAEVYRDTTLICSGAMVHIPLRQTTTNTSKLREILDFQNLSRLKTSVFPHLQKGEYLVKIYRNHPFGTARNQVIGYATVSLEANTTIKVHCTKPATVRYQVLDQNGRGIPQVDVSLAAETQPVSWGSTDSNGRVTLSVPTEKEHYNATVVYKGFLISQQNIRFPQLRRAVVSRTVTMNLSNLQVLVVDTWHLPPEVTLIPQVSSPRMFSKQNLTLQEADPGRYQLQGLPAAPYNLRIRYQSFMANASITLPSSSPVELLFPAEYHVKVRFLDARGFPLSGLLLYLSRGNQERNQTSKGDFLNLSLPPGTYHLEVFSESGIVASRPLQVVGPREVMVISDQDPAAFGFLFGTLGVFAGMAVVGWWRKQWAFLVAGAAIALVIGALWFPWWVIAGSSGETLARSQLYVFPASLISTIQSPHVVSGEMASLPDQFSLVMTVFLLSCMIGSGLLISSVCLSRRSWKLALTLWVASLLFLGASLVVILVSVSVVSGVSVGGMMGSGEFQSMVPGEGLQNIPSTWGLGIGCLLFIGALALSGVGMLIILRKERKQIG